MYSEPEALGAYPVTPVGSAFGDVLTTSVVATPVADAVTTVAHVPEEIAEVPRAVAPCATVKVPCCPLARIPWQ